MLIGGISFFVGWILGYFFCKWINRPVKAGELYFYSGEPGEPPTMAAGLNMSVEEVRKYDEVTFVVSRR